MKKITTLMALVLLLAGCVTTSSGKQTTGKAESEKDANGNYATAQVDMIGDKIDKISLDEYKEGKSKQIMKDSYGMKASSSIGKEWNEQIKFLEDYIVKKGLDKVVLDDKGVPKDADVKTGCTVNVKSMIDTAKEAVKNAK